MMVEKAKTEEAIQEIPFIKDSFVRVWDLRTERYKGMPAITGVAKKLRVIPRWVEITLDTGYQIVISVPRKEGLVEE